MCKNTLDKLYYSELLFRAFRIIFGAFSEKRAIAPSLRALSAETESFQHPGTQTHTASKRHISVEEETNEQRSPCATQSLSFSPRLLRLLSDHPDERTASVRTCSSGASALRSVWGGWGGWHTPKVLWGAREGGWTGRSAGRCVCPSQEELPPREESHPVWRSQTCGANRSKSIRDAIRLPIRIQSLFGFRQNMFSLVRIWWNNAALLSTSAFVAESFFIAKPQLHKMLQLLVRIFPEQVTSVCCFLSEILFFPFTFFTSLKIFFQTQGL